MSSGKSKALRWTSLGVGLVMLFYSFMPAFFGVLSGLLLHWIISRSWRQTLRPMGFTLVCVAGSTLPWLLYTDYIGRGGGLRMFQWLDHVASYLSMIHLYVFPIWLVVALYLFRHISRRSHYVTAVSITVGIFLLTLSFSHIIPGRIYYTIGFLLITALAGGIIIYQNKDISHSGLGLLLIVCVSTVIVTPVINDLFFRYIINLLPVLMILSAWILFRIYTRHRRIGILLILLSISTNLWPSAPYWLIAKSASFHSIVPVLIGQPPLSYLTGLVTDRSIDKAQDPQAILRRLVVIRNQAEINSPIRSDLASYLCEITHDYKGPNEAIVNYFNAHADSNETVLTNYSTPSLIFYTALKVYYTRDFSNLPISDPDWVIIRRTPWATPAPAQVQHFRSTYEQISLDGPDLVWENRPDPADHLFAVPDTTPNMVIYRKSRTINSSPVPPANRQ
ncbi:MAG: hypothetical protein HOH43_26960 [Candidatus Latescibacteria bacterium]|nr:hypothetical protein [Candidatus Latescibacterota bacterium]